MVNIFAEDITIKFKVTKNNETEIIEFVFRQPLEEDKLEILSKIENLGELQEQLDGKTAEEFADNLMSDQKTLSSLIKTQKSTKELMARCLVKAEKWNKSSNQGAIGYINSLDGAIRSKLIEVFSDKVLSAGMDEAGELHVAEVPS